MAPLSFPLPHYNSNVAPIGQRGGGSWCFSAWVAVVLLVVIPLLWLALALTRRRDQAMRLMRRWTRRVFALCGCSLRVSGLPHLDTQRCAIIVANHGSYLDSVVLLAILARDYRFVANRRELTRPLVGLVLRKGEHLIVDRHSIQSREACGRAMLELLNQETSVVLFPEGTRSTRRLQSFENGAFRAAVRTGRPIVPVAIVGTAYMLPRQGRLLRRAHIHVTIRPPIYPTDAFRNAVQLRQHTAAAIAASLDEFGTVSP
jgi:1-acyl-sn-glycerol-3-phosphate acyltransferase